MKRHLTPSVAFMACMALPIPAIAFDLKNDDQVRCEVVDQDPANTRTHTLRRGEALPDICYRCDISVEGIGSISTQPGDTIVVRNRSFQIAS